MTDAELHQASLKAEKAEVQRILAKRENVAGYAGNVAALKDRIAGIDAALAVYDQPVAE